MAKRVSKMIGKPVIAGDSGRKLGTAKDLLLDERGQEVVGLIVAHGVLGREDVLPAPAVQSFGGDAIVSRTSEQIPAKDWRDSQRRPSGAAPAWSHRRD